LDLVLGELLFSGLAPGLRRCLILALFAASGAAVVAITHPGVLEPQPGSVKCSAQAAELIRYMLGDRRVIGHHAYVNCAGAFAHASVSGGPVRQIDLQHCRARRRNR